MLDALARLAASRPRAIVLVFVALAGVSLYFGLGVADALVGGGIEHTGSESARVGDLLGERLGVTDPEITAVLGSEGTPASGVDLGAALEPVIAQLRADPSVDQVRSPLDPGGEALRSADGTRVLLLVDLLGDADDRSDAVERLDPILRSVPLPVLLGGEAPAQVEARDLAMSDIERAELVALPVAAVLLLFFFRGPWPAMLPLAAGAFAVPATLAVLRALGHLTEVSVFALNVSTFIGTGLSIDYALVLVQRQRDELALGHPPVEAMARTLRTSGRAILVSGLAVAGSMLSLLVCPLLLLRSVGLAGALVVLCTLLAALVLLPALMVLLGERVGRSTEARLEGEGVWGRIARGVLRRPLVVAVLSLAVLAWLAVPVGHVRPVTPDAGAFPHDTEVWQVDRLLRTGSLFPGASRSPVLLAVRTPGDVLEPEHAASVAALARQVAALPGVAEVQSPFAEGPLADPATARALLAAGLPAPLQAAVAATTDGDLTLIRVLSDAPRGSPDAEELVRRLRRLHPAGVQVQVGGEAAKGLDARGALAGRLGLAAGLIVAVNVLVLFLAFGSVVVPITAVLINAASLAASLGALVWIFQDGHLSGLLGFESPGGIDVTVPVVLVAIVFGLSMDYEVFLLARIKESWDDTRDNHASIVLGLQRTASIITRAAALLVVVVVGFAMGRFLFVKELGVGMAVAVALDATVVRALLVPATMALVGNANWWAPRSLRRLWERLGLEIREREA